MINLKQVFTDSYDSAFLVSLKAMEQNFMQTMAWPPAEATKKQNAETIDGDSSVLLSTTLKVQLALVL